MVERDRPFRKKERSPIAFSLQNIALLKVILYACIGHLLSSLLSTMVNTVSGIQYVCLLCVQNTPGHIFQLKGFQIGMREKF